MTDPSTLEHVAVDVDLDAAVRCTIRVLLLGVHPAGEHDADYLVRDTCPGCDHVAVFGVCGPAWDAIAPPQVGVCGDCGTTCTRDESATIVEVLR